MVLEPPSTPSVAVPEAANESGSMQGDLISSPLEPCFAEAMPLGVPIFAGCPYSSLTDPFIEVPDQGSNVLRKKYRCPGACEWCKNGLEASISSSGDKHLAETSLPSVSSKKHVEDNRFGQYGRQIGAVGLYSLTHSRYTYTEDKPRQRRWKGEDGSHDCTIV